ncbi:MAG TPA: hypothetical protein VHE33_03190 [Acidobacteriaceae bacterium]|nr:hypothetical protein [Acidobacteriaceae bacterium]
MHSRFGTAERKTAYNPASIMGARFIPVFVLFIAIPRAHGVKPVTIAQMGEILDANRGRSDTRVAGEIAGFKLTERVSARQFAAWEAQFPGPQTQDRLLVLSDESAFQPLPASEISADPSPALSAEEKILDAARIYASKTMRNLPNLLAIRTTVHFQSSSDDALKRARENPVGSEGVDDLPLSFTGQSSAPIAYRDGNEVAVDHGRMPGSHGLTTRDEFGPILTIVLGDAKQGSIVWGYWQRNGNTRIAVFRYRVPAEKSHYLVNFPEGGLIRLRPAYHGEIAIDPETGSILRLSIVSDPKRLPEPAIGVVVEYGSVNLGDRPYIVPLHGIALGKVPIGSIPRQDGSAITPVQTFLNDIAFRSYQLFRADSRILSPEESRQLREEVPAAGSPGSPQHP